MRLREENVQLRNAVRNCAMRANVTYTLTCTFISSTFFSYFSSGHTWNIRHMSFCTTSLSHNTDHWASGKVAVIVAMESDKHHSCFMREVATCDPQKSMREAQIHRLLPHHSELHFFKRLDPFWFSATTPPSPIFLFQLCCVPVLTHCVSSKSNLLRVPIFGHKTSGSAQTFQLFFLINAHRELNPQLLLFALGNIRLLKKKNESYSAPCLSHPLSNSPT